MTSPKSAITAIQEEHMTAPTALDIDNFLPMLDQEFKLPLEQGGILLRLTEVTPYQRKGRFRGGRDPFHLIFQGPLELPLQQGTYLLSAEGDFEHAIFLVPVGREETAMIYQAVFN